MRISQVLKGLHKDDGRRDFWLKIQKLINEGNYGEACARINDHSYDCDFDQQCNVVVKEIAIREIMKVEERENADFHIVVNYRDPKFLMRISPIM